MAELPRSDHQLGWNRRTFLKAAATATGSAVAGLAAPGLSAWAAEDGLQTGYDGFHRPGWELVFSDDFEFFDESKWIKYYDPDRYARGEQVPWGFFPENIHFDNSNLVIQMRAEDDGTYSSGSLRSAGLFETKYGFFEAKMKPVPRNKGCHSAFWLLSLPGVHQVGNDGRDGAEVDVAVTGFVGPQYKSNLHWDGYGEHHQSAGPSFNNAPGINDGEYHYFGLAWTPGSLRYYYDGMLKWTYDGVGVPRVPEFLQFSSGPDSRGVHISEADLPGETLVDWVKVHQPRGGFA